MQLNDRDKPLYVFGPEGVVELVDQLLSLGYFKPTYEIIAQEVDQKDKLDFGDYFIRILRVKHGVPALAYSMEEKVRPGKFNKKKALDLGVPEGPLFSKIQRGQSVTLKNGDIVSSDMVLGSPRNGRKIVFSGDTVPYDKMIVFAKDADVLIHDATFVSELEDIANEYGHSTAFQAAVIAKEANVGCLYLTHISPRYLDCNIVLGDAKKVFRKSFVPEDFDEFDVKLKG
jgi:ribonuclease Z